MRDKQHDDAIDAISESGLLPTEFDSLTHDQQNAVVQQLVVALDPAADTTSIPDDDLPDEMATSVDMLGRVAHILVEGFDAIDQAEAQQRFTRQYARLRTRKQRRVQSRR